MQKNAHCAGEQLQKVTHFDFEEVYGELSLSVFVELCRAAPAVTLNNDEELVKRRQGI